MARTRTSSRSSTKNAKRAAIADDWLQDFIPYVLYRISGKLNLLLIDNLRAVNISKGRWRVMSVLYPDKKLSIGEIADLTVMAQATVSRIIHQLERDKLVDRESDDHDTRIFLISLNDTGRSHFSRLHAHASRHAGIALQGFKPAEVKQLKSYLQRITANIDAHLE